MVRQSSVFGGSKTNLSVTLVIGSLSSKLTEYNLNDISEGTVLMDLAGKEPSEVINAVSGSEYTIKTIIFVASPNLHDTQEWASILEADKLGSYCERNVLVLSVVEASSEADPFFVTTRTPGGNKPLGLTNRRLYEKTIDPKVANLFYYDLGNTIVTQQERIDKGFSIMKEHFYGKKVRHSRNLSLLANPFDVLEIFGDGDLDDYLNPNEHLIKQ